MKTSLFSSCARPLLPALLLILLAPGNVAAADTDPATPDESKSKSSSTDNAGGKSELRDRHDTIRSHESRLNTVGKGIDPSATKLGKGDSDFIEKAAARGMAELRVARLAVERSTDPRIRSFAQQLVSDHEKANAELSTLAGQKGVSLPQENNDRGFKNLSDKTGAEFDQKFVDHISKEHGDEIELFDKASRKSDDADVAAFASKRLPALQEHRRVAKDMEKSLSQ